uniref:Putative RNA-directed DNA polymerase n=1 Tax=Sipha flava TaxID=143950 RepID=A0A2S2PY08_9HEMI
MSNYRPISLLTNFSKIFEKNNLLSKNQFGFRQGLSTENALYQVTQFLYHTLDNGAKTIAIFLDLAKAFDTINHDILSQILPTFGINKRNLLWFQSYLSDRFQQVKLNNILSDRNLIKFGVPQGSVLGPILFLLYINDLCNLNVDGKIITYADETCMLFSGISWNEVYHKATIGLNSIYKCIQDRGLSLNVDKSMFMKFSINKCTNTDSPLLIHNCNNFLICNNINCKQIKYREFVI